MTTYKLKSATTRNNHPQQTEALGGVNFDAVAKAISDSIFNLLLDDIILSESIHNMWMHMLHSNASKDFVPSTLTSVVKDNILSSCIGESTFIDKGLPFLI